VVELTVKQIQSSAVLRLRAALANLRGGNSGGGVRTRASKR
jgi:hypothetical protein